MPYENAREGIPRMTFSKLHAIPTINFLRHLETFKNPEIFRKKILAKIAFKKIP